MVTDRTKEQLWHTTRSGIVIPVGTSATLSIASTQTYLHMKEKAKAIEKLYQDNNVPLSPVCDLAKLVNDAKALSDAWFMDHKEVTTWPLIIRVSFLDRIADAILPLVDVPERLKYLTTLTSDNLNLQQRELSYAKNILWELELVA